MPSYLASVRQNHYQHLQRLKWVQGSLKCRDKAVSGLPGKQTREAVELMAPDPGRAYL
jgi:hypothetical protein